MPMNRRDLPKFPPKWRGIWSDGNDMTITIGESYFEGDDLDKMTLGEDVRLRRFHGHLVLNQPEENGKWSVLLGRRWKDELKLLTFDGSEAAPERAGQSSASPAYTGAFPADRGWSYKKA